MPKATPEAKAKITSRTNPLAKPAKTKDPKQSHLYTDDNPATTLHGTGFKDAAAAYKTIKLVEKRSLLYQWQTINTMYYRALHHPSKSKDMEAAITIFDEWLKNDYPQRKAAMRDFKPLLSKKLVDKLLGKMKAIKEIDTAFAVVYVALGPRKRLANTLVYDDKPGGLDWEQARYEKLCELVPEEHDGIEDSELWREDGELTAYHMQLIAWAWSPVHERKLLAKLNIKL